MTDLLPSRSPLTVDLKQDFNSAVCNMERGTKKIRNINKNLERKKKKKRKKKKRKDLDSKAGGTRDEPQVWDGTDN